MKTLHVSRHLSGRRPGLFLLTVAVAGWSMCMCPAITAQTRTEQSQVILEPLFEYPSPPENMEDLQQRSEWLLTHFWDKMDFKKKAAVDQNALNHAFGIYVLAMQWASADAVNSSVGTLLKNLSKNPTLCVQFTKAAEENLYGPRATLWGDEIYAKFLRSASTNKKVDKSRRDKYAAKLKPIESSLKGQKAPEFKFIRPDGSEGLYFPMATPTLIVFGNPDTPDMRLTRLRMDTNVTFSGLLSFGKVNVLFILPSAPPDDWKKAGVGFPGGMTLGASAEAADKYDLKMDPACYVIDSKGKIADRNLDVGTAIITLTKLVE